MVMLAVPAAHAATPHSAVTALSDRPDSGGNGNWAVDHLHRTLVITRTGSGTYDAILTDTGTFRTIPGAYAPDQGGSDLGTHVTSSRYGLSQVTGQARFSFTATSTPDLRLVPRHVSGSQFSTSTWYELAFPQGTVFGGTGITTWSWHYQLICIFSPHPFQNWTDAWDNGDGQLPPDGNILGC
jgi:hypothetical protein